jgi:hypothetical protein
MFKKLVRIAALLLVLGGSLEIESRGGGGGGHGGGGHGGGGYHGGGHGGYHGGGRGYGGRGYGRGGYGRGYGYGRGWGYGGWGYGYGLGLGYWGAYGWGGWGPYGWYSPWAWSYSYPWWYYANTYGPTWTTRVSVPQYEVDSTDQWTDERGSNYWEFYNDTNLAVTIEGPQGKTELAPKSADKVPHINSFKYVATATDEKGKTHKITVNTTKHYMRVLYKDGKMRIERY